MYLLVVTASTEIVCGFSGWVRSFPSLLILEKCRVLVAMNPRGPKRIVVSCGGTGFSLASKGAGASIGAADREEAGGVCNGRSLLKNEFHVRLRRYVSAGLV